MNKTLIRRHPSILAGFMLLSLTLSSCLEISNELSERELIDLTPEDGAVLPASVEAGDTLTLSRGFTFPLLGALRVKAEGVLVIEPGVTITATGGQPPALFIVIESGAKIFAEGTDEAPIVFTATDQVPGAWGGLIIAGKAPINVGTSAIAEIGDITYGGNEPEDNSGVLRYVRVEYTGSSINSEREHNGITLYGVGSGTTIDFVEAYLGADDGMEFFGGTVNVSHVVCVGNQDDQFDFAQGWTGTASYLYIQQIDDAGFIQDRGIEGDNLSSDNQATPFSSPTIRNVTMVGFSSAANPSNNGTDAIRIREGAKGVFDNVVIQNYPGNAVDARSLITLTNLTNEDLTFTKLYFEGITLPPNTALDDGEVSAVNDLTENALRRLNSSRISDRPSGAEFETWRGEFARLP
ncbi:MAG: hypothetical protein AAGA66_06920 [Bacteroidota bacterium]